MIIVCDKYLIINNSTPIIMKNIFILVTILSTVMFLAGCGGHNHDAHGHEHSHESCSHDHSHDAHSHDADAHEHSHESCSHDHSHDAHNHEHSDDVHSHGHAHDAGSESHSHDGHAHAGESSEPLIFTAYGDSLEIFAEIGKLQAGEESFIIAHLTRLSDYKPLDVPEVKFALDVAGSAAQFTAKRERPGIYRCHITPAKGGKGKIVCKAQGTAVSFPVEVCEAGEHHHEAHESHEHGSNMVSFPKEQSWKIDFGTEIVRPRTINSVVKGVAKVSNAPENITTVVAATSGKVHYSSAIAAGSSVAAGSTLFVLETGDVADGNAAIKFADAESRYNYTKAEYERKAELVKTKIVSLSDFQAAEAEYLRAKAVFENLSKNFKGGKMLLKSPMSGYISDIAVASGDYVEEGTPLATLERDGDLQLYCEVPVRHAAALRNLSDINIELNDGTCYSLAEVQGRITAVGRAVQKGCNMLPVTVMAKNLKGVIPGNIVNLYLIAPEKGESITVPRTALVEEMGKFFVFVQHTPVMFEKRLVAIGTSDGKDVRLLSGVEAGERVVTKGTVSLKLAQGAGALDPHAGHVH